MGELEEMEKEWKEIAEETDDDYLAIHTVMTKHGFEKIEIPKEVEEAVFDDDDDDKYADFFGIWYRKKDRLLVRARLIFPFSIPEIYEITPEDLVWYFRYTLEYLRLSG